MTHLTFIGAGALALVLMYVLFGRSKGLDAQLVANRRVPYPFAGLWMAVAFTFGTTYFFSGQTMYQNGLAGFLWYAIGNTAGLVLAMTLASQIPAPQRMYSLAEAMGERYGARSMVVYTASLTGIQALYILPLQFIAAGKLFESTMGADPRYTIVIAAVSMIIPTMFGGMRSSAAIDLVKGGLMLAFIALALAATSKAGYMNAVFAPRAAAPGFFDWNLVASSHGFAFFASLLSGGAIDQSLFQRYFSVARGPKRAMRIALISGAVFFAMNMAAGAILGAMAANPSLHIAVSDPAVAGFAALKHLLPGAVAIFAVAVVISFMATGDSALNASSTVVTMDVYRRCVEPAASDDRLRFVQRIVMLIFVLAGAAVALSHVSMLWMVVAVGVFRSSLLVPTVVGLLTDKRRVPDAFWGIVAGMAASVVLFIAGATFAAAMAGWIITGAHCAYLAYRSRRCVAIAV